DAGTGAKKWEFVTDDQVNTPVAIAADGTVYFGSDDFKVYAVDGATGVKKWEFRTEYMVEGGATIASDGTVYFLGWDGLLYALAGTSPLAQSPWAKFHSGVESRGSLEVATGSPQIFYQTSSTLSAEGAPMLLNVIAGG